MPVIDTTLLVQAERLPEQTQQFVEDLIHEDEPLLVPLQVAIEYASGRTDPAEALRKLRSAFALVPCGPEIGLEAARMAREARLRGVFPGWGDIQIAATAHHEGMAVVTKNGRHFEALGVRVRRHP